MSSHEILCRDADHDKITARQILDAQNQDLTLRGFLALDNSSTSLTDSTEYFETRSQFVRDEQGLAFDSKFQARATPLEREADDAFQELRLYDRAKFYSSPGPRQGFGGQMHPIFEGDHFLSNRPLLEQTSLFEALQEMPKGTHLHIHYNACLPPKILLDIAKSMERMFIASTLPLIADRNFANYDECEIQFSIRCPETANEGDLFSPGFKAQQAMKFNEFLRQFSQHRTDLTADEWLLQKLMFHEEEAHGMLQTVAGTWEKFNGRTRMMKGLFNYVTAFRQYTRHFLDDLMRDHILYAEIRLTFMKSNQLFTDDGTGRIDNRGIVSIIVEEVTRFKTLMEQQKRFFGGIKVIYAAPRSFHPDDIEESLNECINLKQEFPQWIAGFDLVGEESKGRPLKDFVAQLIPFQKRCRELGLHIPFLFHCGETLELGTDVDGNVVDAILLGAERVGHCFALPKHPRAMQEIKARGICVEGCPISNEVLGLTPRISGHSIYTLLANNVHCTVNSDNGTLFGSTLSHDFYQVVAGRADFSVFGLKQLILWSLEHACLDESERAAMLQVWDGQWELWLHRVIGKAFWNRTSHGSIARA